MNYMGIDPGNEQSAYIMIRQDGLPVRDVGDVLEGGKVRNRELLRTVRDLAALKRAMQPIIVGIEMVASYGMPVGKSVFDTARWTGRFEEAARGLETYLVYRKSPNKDNGIDSVCMHLCKSTRAKDSNVRQALIDRYETTGGGKIPQIGTKSKPGPLYGISADVWSALAVAITLKDCLARAPRSGS